MIYYRIYTKKYIINNNKTTLESVEILADNLSNVSVRDSATCGRQAGRQALPSPHHPLICNL